MQLYYLSGAAGLFCFYKYFAIAKMGQDAKRNGASPDLIEWFTDKASTWFSRFLICFGLTAISYLV